MSNGTYYRLTIRFTNGETVKFVVHQPIDGGQITERTKFAIVRARRGNSDDLEQVVVASFADISYVKSQRIEEKDLRHRVAGITGSIGFGEEGGPEAIATIEFV
jgi:hypothetical protein